MVASDFLSSILLAMQQKVMIVFLLMIFLSAMSALINIIFSSGDDVFDLSKFIRRLGGSVITYLILLLMSLVPFLQGMITVPIIAACLILVREISVALQFTGLDLTPLTLFVNTALNAVASRFGSQVAPDPNIPQPILPAKP